jgi:short-subunit dehydrogenase
MKYKIAVITGGASGIGLALAKKCLEKNMHVVIADNATIHLSKAVHTLSSSYQNEVLGIQCDVSNTQEVERLAKETFDRFGKIDLLINNAGISGKIAPVWELSYQEIQDVLMINLMGIINGVKAFLPYLFSQGNSCHIVNMASVYSLCSGSSMAAYSSAKHGVLAFTEALYFDLLQQAMPITVSVACPSFVNTALIANSIKSESSFNQDLLSLMERSRPVDEVAEYILKEIENKTFYILPDKEVKNYCEQRVNAIFEESLPAQHSLEKLLSRLKRRNK